MKGLDFPDFSTFGEYEVGYRTAYSVADNFDMLDQQLDQWQVIVSLSLHVDV